MGMYTELVMACRLRKDTPEDVIKILKYMCRTEDVELSDLKIPTNHDLFTTERWNWMLVCDSFYFSGDSHTTFSTYEGISKDHFLTVRSNLKNYNNEIENFLDWLSPYMKDHGFLGYMRFEATDTPTLFYRKYNGEIVYDRVDYPEEGDF